MRRAGADQPLAECFDVALLDLDGVVYIGDAPVQYAIDALAHARRSGQRHVYVTNNAARPPSVVADHLRGLGVDAADSNVVTSAVATAQQLGQWIPPGSTVLAVGGVGVSQALTMAGFHVLSTSTVDQADHDSVAGRADAVVMGFGPDVGWRDLALAATTVRRGVPFVATNLDRTVPTPTGPAPGNGMLVAAVAAAARAPDLVVGKPAPHMFHTAAASVGARRPLVIGDRLDTDIEGAVAAGFASLLVLTGVTDLHDLVQAPPHQRPTYVGRDLRSLNQVHGRAIGGAGAARRATVGAWTAVRDGDTVRLTPDRRANPLPDLDAVQAACAASWGPAGGSAAEWSPPRRIEGLDRVLPPLPAE